MPLKLKLSLVITVVLVVTVVLLSAMLLRQQQKTLTAEMVKRGLTIAQNLAASAKNPLVSDDELTLNLLVKEAMQDPDVAYVAITDEKGKALAHSDVHLVGRPLERPANLTPLGGRLLVQTYEAAGGADVIDFSVPLSFRRVAIGALYLGVSQRANAAALARARNNAVLVSVAMVLLGIAGAFTLGAVLSRPISRLMEGTRAIAEGDYHVTLRVPSRDEIGALTQSFNDMAASLREKNAIKRAFTRYVAREVVTEILKDPDKIVLTGERREVTVLFCDVRGFTSLSERLAPEEVVTLLNAFYTLMIDTTFKHDGTLDKFLGDGVMAIFGAPIFHPDHCLRALRTALAMQAGIRELSARRVAEGKAPLRVGIGVNAGSAVAGSVGTEARMEYTVIGDSVNVAARLESYAKPGQILITEHTHGLVRDAIEARALGRLKVRGKEEELEVYEVLGVRGE
ncbi:MAG TPA: adenylate/guanylate cyclase domain-containing protein [Candidatus Binatia bacterium]|nr:adenylate/guanylate cyclase domain-containing protein [Candidatus Binatia bacterium]